MGPCSASRGLHRVPGPSENGSGQEAGPGKRVQTFGGGPCCRKKGRRRSGSIFPRSLPSPSLFPTFSSSSSSLKRKKQNGNRELARREDCDCERAHFGPEGRPETSGPVAVWRGWAGRSHANGKRGEGRIPVRYRRYREVGGGGGILHREEEKGKRNPPTPWGSSACEILPPPETPPPGAGSGQFGRGGVPGRAGRGRPRGVIRYGAR